MQVRITATVVLLLSVVQGSEGWGVANTKSKPDGTIRVVSTQQQSSLQIPFRRLMRKEKSLIVSKCANRHADLQEDDEDNMTSVQERLSHLILSSPTRSVLFSMLMILSGAALGPFLDSFHSAFGVLQYNTPITAQLWGVESQPALITSWWVPELFGLAGFLIGWLYLMLDTILYGKPVPSPAPPKILIGISFFTFQYWLSGLLFHSADRTTILNIMSVAAVLGFAGLDGTLSGFLTSAATAIGGPLIEVGLLQLTVSGIFKDGYHYTDLGETGFFPLWIIPVYFLGGPANGNLARGFWSLLSSRYEADPIKAPPAQQQCTECNGTRCVPCPNWCVLFCFSLQNEHL